MITCKISNMVKKWSRPQRLNKNQVSEFALFLNVH